MCFPFHYKIYNQILASDFSFPQLIPAEQSNAFSKPADITIKSAPLPVEIAAYLRDIHPFYYQQDQLAFRNQTGCFLISNGRQITVQEYPEITQAQITPFLLGYAMAMLFWQRNQLAIHCSAIEYKGKALLIAGGSGSGKSSLTHRYLSAGARLLCDDMAILQQAPSEILVLPAFPQQKLCRDTAIRMKLDLDQMNYIDEARDKFALSCREHFCNTPVPLHSIIFLNRWRDPEVAIVRLQGHSALCSLINNLFLHPMFEQECNLPPKDMLSLLSIVNHANLFQLHRPETGDSTLLQFDLINQQL